MLVSEQALSNMPKDDPGVDRTKCRCSGADVRPSNGFLEVILQVLGPSADPAVWSHRRPDLLAVVLPVDDMLDVAVPAAEGSALVEREPLAPGVARLGAVAGSNLYTLAAHLEPVAKKASVVRRCEPLLGGGDRR